MTQIRFTQFDGGSFDPETGLNTGGTLIPGAGFHGLPSGDNTHPIQTDDPRYLAATDLQLTVARVLTEIDQAAEAGRMQHITPGDGQALTYEAKRQEAVAWFNDPARPATATEFPFLFAEAEARGLSRDQVATEIWINAGLWGGVIGPAIEKARTSFKDAARVSGADLQQVLADALVALAAAADPLTHSAELAAMHVSRATAAATNTRGQ